MIAANIMTVNQLSHYLQLNKQTIYRKAKKGEIPTIVIGKTLRFKKDVIDNWLVLSSLSWSSKKRADLRQWAEGFAKSHKITEKKAGEAAAKRRAKS